MEPAPDLVHTIEGWYDGPRSGAANFEGRPHYYRSLYLDSPTWDPEEDRFELTPISADILESMLTAHRLWQRWDAARKAGALPASPADGSRVLPEDRAEYDALTRDIEASLSQYAGPRTIARGTFTYRPDRVRWLPVDPSARGG